MKLAHCKSPAITLAAVLSILAPCSAATALEATVAVAEPAMRAVTLTGFTRAQAQLPLMAEVAGRVASVTYDIGDTIGADGRFARIDDIFLRLELEQVEVQQARLDAQIAFDEREVKRYEKLARKSNAAVSQLDAFTQTLTNNRSELRQLKVEQHVLTERLTRTRISAPVGWHVIERRIEPGQWVNVGEHLGTVADFTTLTVPFALTPEQLAALGTVENQPSGIRLTLTDMAEDVPASLWRVNPGFDPDTRKIAVELKLSPPPAPSRGGLRAQLTIPMPERSGAVLLPPEAVRQSYEEYWVDPVEGDPIRVVLLGRYSGPNGDRLRVSSPDILPGARFRTVNAEALNRNP